MKYILVTGAGGGMGREVVKQLAMKGYTVFAMDKISLEPAERVVPIIADIADTDELQRAFEEVCSYTDTLYAIIHFAGVYMLNSLVEISDEDFLNIFNVNIIGAYRVNKLFHTLLKSGSRILITTSELATLEPLPFTGLYSVTKAALDKYAASLRMELQLKNFSVSVLRPGAIQTGMLDVSVNQLDKFAHNTQLYQLNALRFRKIVQRVEAKCLSADKLANKVLKIMECTRPRPIYSINRNPLLMLLDLLPVSVQNWIIKQILK